MNEILLRIIFYPISFSIFLCGDFINDSLTTVPETTYQFHKHSEEIISHIEKYKREFTYIDFIYNKKTFNEAFDKIGLYSIMGISTDHLAYHTIKNMLTTPTLDLVAFTYYGKHCYISINPARMGAMGIKDNDGIFNIDFIILHEIGHCKMKLSLIESMFDRKDAEYWADIYALKEIKQRDLNVDTNIIIRDRSYSDIPSDEHLNGDRLKTLDLSFFN